MTVSAKLTDVVESASAMSSAATVPVNVVVAESVTVRSPLPAKDATVTAPVSPPSNARRFAAELTAPTFIVAPAVSSVTSLPSVIAPRSICVVLVATVPFKVTVPPAAVVDRPPAKLEVVPAPPMVSAPTLSRSVEIAGAEIDVPALSSSAKAPALVVSVGAVTGPSNT